MGAKLHKQNERPSFIQYPVVEKPKKSEIVNRSHDDSLVFGQIPYDLKIFLLSNFFDPKSLCRMRLISSSFCSFIDDNDLIWKLMHNRMFPQEIISETCKYEFIQKWREINIVWDVDVEFKGKSKTYTHGPGTHWVTIRTNMGFTKGIHYWELIPHKCALHTIIGVGFKDVEHTYELGRTNRGWGFSLGNGQLHNNRYVSKAEKGYDINSRVGVLLDMDKYEISFYINKELVLYYSCPMWKGRMVYPAASLFQHQDQIAIETNVTKPQ